MKILNSVSSNKFPIFKEIEVIKKNIFLDDYPEKKIWTKYKWNKFRYKVMLSAWQKKQ